MRYDFPIPKYVRSNFYSWSMIFLFQNISEAISIHEVRFSFSKISQKQFLFMKYDFPFPKYLWSNFYLWSKIFLFQNITEAISIHEVRFFFSKISFLFDIYIYISTNLGYFRPAKVKWLINYKLNKWKEKFISRKWII